MKSEASESKFSSCGDDDDNDVCKCNTMRANINNDFSFSIYFIFYPFCQYLVYQRTSVLAFS
jgi:hypothetical protein